MRIIIFVDSSSPRSFQYHLNNFLIKQIDFLEFNLSHYTILLYMFQIKSNT